MLRLTTKHGTEVTYDVDDEENGTFLRSHGKVTASCIAIDWVSGSGADEGVENCAWRTEDLARGISGERKDQDDDQEHEGMHVVTVILSV